MTAGARRPARWLEEAEERKAQYLREGGVLIARVIAALDSGCFFARASRIDTIIAVVSSIQTPKLGAGGAPASLRNVLV